MIFDPHATAAAQKQDLPEGAPRQIQRPPQGLGVAGELVAIALGGAPRVWVAVGLVIAHHHIGAVSVHQIGDAPDHLLPDRRKEGELPGQDLLAPDSRQDLLKGSCPEDRRDLVGDPLWISSFSECHVACGFPCGVVVRPIPDGSAVEMDTADGELSFEVQPPEAPPRTDDVPAEASEETVGA